MRDSVFLVEIASAQSLSTNIWCLRQSGRGVATRGEEKLVPAADGFSFPPLGAEEHRALSLIATKTPLLKCCIDKHKPNVMKLAQCLLQERWLLHSCNMRWARRLGCVRGPLNAQLPLFIFALIWRLSWATTGSIAQHFESAQVTHLFSAQEPVWGSPPATFKLRTVKHQQSLRCALRFDHCHLFFSSGKCLKQLL